MLGHRLRRWPNIKPTSSQCIVFAGIHSVLTLDGWSMLYQHVWLNAMIEPTLCHLSSEFSVWGLVLHHCVWHFVCVCTRQGCGYVWWHLLVINPVPTQGVASLHVFWPPHPAYLPSSSQVLGLGRHSHQLAATTRLRPTFSTQETLPVRWSTNALLCPAFADWSAWVGFSNPKSEKFHDKRHHFARA